MSSPGITHETDQMYESLAVSRPRCSRPQRQPCLLLTPPLFSPYILSHASTDSSELSKLPCGIPEDL